MFLGNEFEFNTNTYTSKIRARQRSGEGVVRRNGCPRGCFRRVRFFSAPLRFALKTSENLKGAKKNGLSKNTLLDNRFSARRLRPCPTYQLWPFSSAKENHPKMAVRFQTVFSKRCFQIPHLGACDRRKRLQRDKECLKTPVFLSILVPSALCRS